MSTVMRWLPETTTKTVRIFAWASLVSQILIIGTGGAVRLTGSGLGCPTWPRCTDDSFISTPEMGFHGLIEFGNRLLTFVLAIIAVVMVALLLRLRRERPELFRLAVVLALGIPGQAVIGGITVLTDLNPWVVGLHYVLSLVLVALAAVLLYRVRTGPKTNQWAVPAPFRVLGSAVVGVLSISLVMGVITTGSGPHSGDGGAARNGLDSWLLQHFHAWPSYVVLGLIVTMTVLTWVASIGGPILRRATTGALAVTAVQIGVGLYQARNGLPELAVGVHMVLAAVLLAVVTTALLAQRAPTTREEAGQPPQRQTADLGS